MPTAFVAEYGSGAPVIDPRGSTMLCRSVSQEVTGARKPAAGRTTGHGCGTLYSRHRRGRAALASSTSMTNTNSRGRSASTERPRKKRDGKVYMLLRRPLSRSRRVPALASGHQEPDLLQRLEAACRPSSLSAASRPTPPAVPTRARALSTASSYERRRQLHARAHQGDEPRPLCHHNGGGSRTSCPRRPRSGITCGPTITPTSRSISIG